MGQQASPNDFDIATLIKSIGSARPQAASTASSSSSSVSVNPVISVINGGGGSPTFSPSGSASSSPSAIADARPVYRSAYGLGSGVTPLDAAGDLPLEAGGSNAQGAGILGLDFVTIGLVLGGGLLAWYLIGSK